MEIRFLKETKDLHWARVGTASTGSSREPSTTNTTPLQPLSAPLHAPDSQYDLAVTQDDLDFLEKHLREIGELEGCNDNEKPKAKNGAAKVHGDTKTKRPALWRDIGVKSRTTYIFREIEAAGCFPQVFTLRIDPALLVDQANPAEYMHRRIRDSMKKEFGRNIAIAGAMEWRGKDGNELHIHGVVGGLTEIDLERARRALRAAGGDWREGPGRGRQVDLKPIDDDRGGVDGWAGYCCKDVRATQTEIDQRRRALGEESSRSPRVDFASREVQQAAADSYKRDRAEILGDTKISVDTNSRRFNWEGIRKKSGRPSASGLEAQSLPSLTRGARKKGSLDRTLSGSLSRPEFVATRKYLSTRIRRSKLQHNRRRLMSSHQTLAPSSVCCAPP